MWAYVLHRCRLPSDLRMSFCQFGVQSELPLALGVRSTLYLRRQQ